ncbi:hypothetical protein RFN58_15785 [Streptomyces iakyrus]|uniref:hypothetical protein n=1 Tax=Streptomyces iakyrus TaxID=68219 RepID=UPI000526C99A|nr:hypothetical protein [Streptomyces iakyrus]
MLDVALVARLDARAGGTVRLTGPDGLRSWRVSGIADPHREPPRQYAVFHSPREAQRLAVSAQPVRRSGPWRKAGAADFPGTRVGDGDDGSGGGGGTGDASEFGAADLCVLLLLTVINLFTLSPSSTP